MIHCFEAECLGERGQWIVIGLVQPGSAVIKACRIGIGAATDAILRFQHQAGKPARVQRARGGNAGNARAHHQHIGFISVHAAPSR